MTYILVVRECKNPGSVGIQTGLTLDIALKRISELHDWELLSLTIDATSERNGEN